jgi:hypothetical protein
MENISTPSNIGNMDIFSKSQPVEGIDNKFCTKLDNKFCTEPDNKVYTEPDNKFCKRRGRAGEPWFPAILQEAKSDPTLQSTLDIENIIKSVNNVDVDYLGDRTLKDIAKEIYEAIQEFDLPKQTISAYCGKLVEYRLVDAIYQLHKGKHVRWIRIANSHASASYQLTNGGIVVDIRFLDNGTHIICKNKNRFIQYKFDDCITFQKLSQDEQLLLSCYDMVS